MYLNKIIAACFLVTITSLIGLNQIFAEPEDLSGEIVFETDRDGNYEIYLMEADGSNQRNITNNPAFDTYPIWSPNGDLIAFLSDRNNSPYQFSLYVMDSDGNNVQHLLPEDLVIYPETYAVTGAAFYWSPDGTKIAVSAANVNDTITADYIFIVDLQSQDVRQVSLNRGFSPVWSLDGNFIAFAGRLSTDWDRRWSFGIIALNQPYELNISYLVDGPAYSYAYPDYVYREEIDYTEGETLRHYSFTVRLHSADGGEPVNNEFVFEQRNNIAYITIQNPIDETTTLRGGRRLQRDNWEIQVTDDDGDWDIYLSSAVDDERLQLTTNTFYDGSPDWRPVPQASVTE